MREDGETCFGVGVAVRVVHQLETFYASVPLALADFYISEGYYLHIYYWRGIIQIIQWINWLIKINISNNTYDTYA